MSFHYKAFTQFAKCWHGFKMLPIAKCASICLMLISLLVTSSQANDIAGHEFLGWQNLDNTTEVSQGDLLSSGSFNYGFVSTCPKPSNGSATVDGNISDWDLNKDFFADMYRAGNPNKVVESKLYLKYDCEKERLCMLVKTVPGVIALKQPGDAFLKLKGVKIVDGNSGSSKFRWIYLNSMLVGFEACAQVDPGQYTDLNVHLQVMDMESQTSAVADRMIPICLDECPCKLIVKCPKMWQGGNKPCDFEIPPLENLSDFENLGGSILESCDDPTFTYVDEGGACAGWLKRVITIDDGTHQEKCTVQWDFKKEDLKIHCPAAVELQCESQEYVDDKFAWWLKEYKVDGACGWYEVTTRPRNPKAPDACEGGSVEVEFKVTDECGRTKKCKTTFKVNAPKPVEAHTPGDKDVAYCLSQKNVNAEFAAWLAGFKGEGGCDLAVNIIAEEGSEVKYGDDPKAPNKCGGYIKVKIIVFDLVCLQLKDEQSAIFRVKDAPPIVLDCPDDKWIKKCCTQEEVDAKFKAWLMEFDATGGCGMIYSDLWGYKAPPACGGKQEVTFWAYDKCGQREECTRTFHVEYADELIVDCPLDYRTDKCLSQADVNKYYYEWLAGFTVTGGCKPKYPNVEDLAKKYPAPDACGGKVTVEFWVTDLCSKEKGCQATFTVPYAPKLEVHCAKDYKTEACLTQDDVDKYYYKWLEGFYVKGGCDPQYPTLKELAEKYPAPDACGGEVTVDFWVSDYCHEEKGCQGTFTVPHAPKLEVYCADRYKTEPCLTQEEVNKYYYHWLKGFYVKGGCDPQYPTLKELAEKYPAPDACGGKVTVDFWVSDYCHEEQGCQGTFIVPRAPKLEVHCADNYKTEPCLTQEEVNKYYYHWLKGFYVEGGCDPQYPTLKELAEKYPAPDACGGKVTVDFWVTDYCHEEKGCKRTFVVPRAPKLVVHCADDYKTESCLTQEEVNKYYYHWLKGFYAEGGCDPQYPSPKELAKKYPAPDACGGKVTIDFWVTDRCYGEKGCKATFTVPRAPKLEVHCADNYKTEPCLTQEEVNKYYYHWLKGFYAEGGCDPQYPTLEELAEKYPAPNACGGKVTVDFWVTDYCHEERGCKRTFVVPRAPKLVVHCADNYKTEPCLTQEEVNKYYYHWLKGFYAEGGCDPQYLTLEELAKKYPAPDACGGKVTVDFWVTDYCHEEKGCQGTFIVPRVPKLEVHCADNYKTEPCLAQEEVNKYYYHWLKGFYVKGGCDPQYPTLEELAEKYPAPDACGGKVTVDFWVTDYCHEEKGCKGTFIVPLAPKLEVYCADNYKTEPCLTQEEVNKYYYHWLKGFYVKGGCDPQYPTLKELAEKYPAPDACGGQVTVDFWVTDYCHEEKGCQRTFTVPPAPELVVHCAYDYSTEPCLTQEEVNKYYYLWLKGFYVEGGCDPQYPTIKQLAKKYPAPDACGGKVTVDFWVTDYCHDEKGCQATFTVPPAPKLVVHCADDYKTKSCPTQEEVDKYYYHWLKGFYVEGGCDPQYPTLRELAEKYPAPRACGGKVTVDFWVTDRCYGEKGCKATFVVPHAPDRIVFKGIPGNQKIACGSEPPAWPKVTAENGCGRYVKVTRSQRKSSIRCGSVQWIRTWIAKDECGHVARRTQKIYYEDKAPPVLNIPDDITLKCGEKIPEPEYEAYDDCSDIRVEFEEKRKDDGCEYTLTRTWTVYDGCGRKTVKSQTIKVVDNEAPVITPVNPMLVDMPMGGEMVTYSCEAPAIRLADVNVYDDCCNFTVETKDEIIANVTCDAFGYYRKWKCSVTATDDAGNSSEYYFYMLQYDTLAPEILNVPEDVELGCNDTVPAAATDVEVKDNCSLETVPEFSVEVFYDPEDSSKYGIVRTWFSTDHCGNYGEDYQVLAKCGFDVSLIDAKLGNAVWLDENGNGLQETEEPGLDGITVYLHEVRIVNGETKTSIVDSTVTATLDGNAGQYVFDELARGTYQLEFAKPGNMEFTIPFEGVDATNSDVDPLTGRTVAVYVGYGQRKMNFDAGFVKGPLSDAAPLADFGGDISLETKTTSIDEISVYPNPTSALINISMHLPQDGQVKLSIMDQLGQVVKTETRMLNRGTQNEAIDLHSIPAGTYLLNVQTTDQTMTKMIIKN